MSKDGINISEAPVDFKRPDSPPGLPPLDCRCGAKAEEVLDGSLWGCSKCCVGGSSIAEWNSLVNGDEPPVENRAFAHLLASSERYLQFRHDADVGFGWEYEGGHPETQLRKAITLAKEAIGHDFSA